MDKLYYVAAPYLIDGEDFTYTDDVKDILIYEIIDNVPKVFANLEVEIQLNSESEIQVWLDNNGYGDKEFEFIEL